MDSFNFQEIVPGKKIIAYGAGNAARYFLKMTENILNITAFCDKDEKKQKVTIDNYKIISPETLREKYLDSYIIITLLNDEHISDVLSDLSDIGGVKKVIKE